MHTSDEEVFTSSDEANEPLPDHPTLIGYADLSDDPDEEEPGSETEPAPLTEFEEQYVVREYADLSDDPDEEEPSWETEPAPLSEFEEHYLRLNYAELSDDPDAKEPG